ncbi:MAG TPA: DMT family transporter [Firmicutes bacterium]|uniref:DMT family transporter n=1 Tax=Capillibacterium thermochitinicola TaxID=2699427 RepID=A0A8J6HVQ6_9FIRM|nr:DMT family transporter [Capillibacterium thermochitinicola]MBA2132057.1 DMT family transporter [Capillibacterium thermochitinicola]HHW11994.1 DMT family transporter [Bacillota bacterium]
MYNKHRSALLLFLTAAIWGGTFIIVKESLAVLQPMAVIAYRFTIAFLFLALLYRRLISKNWRPALRPGLGLGFILTLAFATQTIGLKYTTPAVSALLTGMNGVFVALIETVFYRKRLTRPAFLGLMAATFGLLLITWPTEQFTLDLGILLTLACALLYAWHIVALGRAVAGSDPTTLTIIQFAVVATIAWFFTPGGLSAPLQMGAKIWGAILYLAIPATGIAFFCQSLAQQRLSPVATAIILATEPAFATLFSLLLGYEPCTLKLITGGLLLIGGAILSTVGESFKPEAGKMIA